LRLTVGDQGRGFDPKTLAHTGGSGLLSIRERIELLGGRMKIRSAPGRGSTFLIAVPDGDPSGTATASEPGGAEETVHTGGDRSAKPDKKKRRSLMDALPCRGVEECAGDSSRSGRT
jgi:hypothetical protein